MPFLHFSHYFPFLTLFFVGSLFAFEMAPPFQDGAVLQRDMPVKIFGTASAQSQIEVSLDGQNQSVQAGESGSWSVTFPAKSAGGPYQIIATSGSETIEANDVYFGEVWVGSGQSNMALKVSDHAEVAEPFIAEDSLLRCGTMKRGTLEWQSSYFKNNGDFSNDNCSAILYIFGHQIREMLQVPVGLIVSASHGTSVREWLPGKDEFTNDTLDSWRNSLGNDITKDFWAEQFDDKIKPIAGLGIKGMIWDQGEAGTKIDQVSLNQGWAELVKSWRKIWDIGDIPFIAVQYDKGHGWAKGSIELQTSLPDPDNDTKPENAPTKSSFSDFLALPKTEIVSSVDLNGSTHPPDKHRYAKRFFLAAKKMVYGEDIVADGPFPIGYEITENDVIIQFASAGSGLVAEGGLLQGFALKKENGDWVWADAEIISRDKIRVTSSLQQPTHLGYMYHKTDKSGDVPSGRIGNDWCNLYNEEGLPAWPVYQDLGEAPTTSFSMPKVFFKQRNRGGITGNMGHILFESESGNIMDISGAKFNAEN